MKIKDAYFFFALKIALLISVSFLTVLAQNIDPFYINVFEKAQKSFLAKDYAEAARGFEVAAFGLLENRQLRAKAYIYLSLCRYYLKDLAAAEKSLREAASLMGDEGFRGLAIYETAWPDLEKLMGFFNISSSQNQEVPREVEKISPDFVVKPGNENPSAGSSKAEKTPTSTPEKSALEKTPPESSPLPPQNNPVSRQPALRFDEIKEGDLIPLELLDSPPRPIKQVAAVRPLFAGSSDVEGTVILNVLVSERGDVLKAEVIRGIKQAFGFDQAAQRAVRQWKFEPGSIRGIRVKVWMPVAIEFKKGAAD